MPLAIRALIQGSGLPASEARLLLAAQLGVDRAWLIAHAEEPLDDARCAAAGERFGRRRRGEPVAYLLGAREFYGLDLAVTPDVLIPRPETELLVELALRLIDEGARRVLDLGTGSGAIAVAVARAAPQAEVWATDASAAALALACANAKRHAPHVRLEQSDWFASLAGERFDLIVANPPYVEEDDPHLAEGDVRFEPRAALVGGPDGLDCIRRIVREARSHLAPGGRLLFEHGHDQGARCRALLAAQGYADIATWPDLAGIPRVTGGRAP
ncbi:MAG: peptide chain release factor N(5)-glutamine methyltransferase [Burkholderiales bacterium]|nr:peptide chain release factor N(5)-glutamine methyltransferase [Burkholderiales bacterium]